MYECREAIVPTYQYACTACGHQLEAVQSFADEPLTECPACEGRLRKLFSSVGIVFKGSGFYRTDSRADRSGKAGASHSSGKDSTPAKTGGDTSSSGGSSATKSDSSGSSSSSGSTSSSGSSVAAKAA
jgi:putative FmdB family regulatory protein